MQVSQLYIYPIKSLGGIALQTVEVTDRGFQYDRRWMLIDTNNRFISQREVAEMALLKVNINSSGLEVFHIANPSDILKVQFGPYNGLSLNVSVWDTGCNATLVSEAADSWFSKKLNIECRLVYMNDEDKIQIDEKYNINNRINSFSDGFPILIASEASLNDLNNRLDEALPMNRFRPNLVISGTKPFEENEIKEFTIGDIHFFGVKPCARCVVTTIDQSNAVKGKEPLKTLATYRNYNNKILFGENVIAMQTGSISVGDAVRVLQTKEALI